MQRQDNPPNGRKRFAHHPLAAPLPLLGGSSRINTTVAQKLREEKARTAKNENKADMNEVARILRCAAKAL